MKISALVYCTQANQQAGAPGKSSRTVRFQTVSPKDSVDNAKLFDAESGNFDVNLNGLTKDLADGFDAGQSYTLTIETTNPTPGS